MSVADWALKAIAFVTKNSVALRLTWGVVGGTIHGAYLIFKPIVDDWVAQIMASRRAAQAAEGFASLAPDITAVSCQVQIVIDGSSTTKLDPRMLEQLADRMEQRLSAARRVLETAGASAVVARGMDQVGDFIRNVGAIREIAGILYRDPDDAAYARAITQLHDRLIVIDAKAARQICKVKS